MYYLQSRYYDPVVGRFVNGDIPEILFLFKENILGSNLSAYTSNNPVCYSDYNGYVFTNVISGIIGAFLNVLIDLLTSALAYWLNKRFSLKGFRYNLFSWNTVLVAASGFAGGLIISSSYSRKICAIGGGVVSGLTNIISCIINRRKFSILNLIIDVGFGLIWGYLGGSGVGNGYWQKNWFSKGGYFVYRGIKYSTKNILLIKPVVKDFLKSFGKYMGMQIGDWLQRFAREKI